MVKYLVWIYMPKKGSYDFAGFTTSRISFSLAGLNKTASTEKDTLQLLNEIRTHDSFAAVIPSEFSETFAHEFLNYATLATHENNVGIAIRAYSDDTTLKYAVDWSSPRPLHRFTTLTRHSIATVKLFKTQFQSFVAVPDDSYTILFRATGGDKMIIGPEPGTQGDLSTTFETDL